VALYLPAKTTFQSFSMSTTTHPFFGAASKAVIKVPLTGALVS
jgi:hypothetical protein